MRDVTVGTSWTQLTSADTTALTFQNRGISNIFVKATAGATPPTSLDGAIVYGSERGETSNVTLANLFPGVSGANRLYAIREFGSGPVAVSQV
jgi:hypothetical protein